MKKTFSLLLALALVLSFSVVAVPVGVVGGSTSTINVSQPTYLTSNGDYDRNPSIIYDGSYYWVFWTKADNAQVRGTGTHPDGDTYVVYYKKATTIGGLASAAEVYIGKSLNYRPANFTQRVVSATYFKGDTYAFVSSGQDGTDRGLYYYKLAAGATHWDQPTTLIADTGVPNRGGHVNVVSDSNRVYIVWECSDGTADAYTWDGTTLSSKIDISSDNQPKITLMGTTLYVVSIEDSTGDIEVYSAAAGASPSFTHHSTAISAAGLYDPCIFNDGTDLYVVTAPYVGGNDQQYLIQTKYTGTWATARTVNLGGYGGTYWWDYWPVGYWDGSDPYIFFTTETNSPTYSDAEIAFIKMDWALGNDHYFYIQNAVGQATSGDTINVAAGTYDEGIIQINKNLTITGATTPSKPIINPTANTGTANVIGATGRGWFQIHGGATVNFKNLVFDGTGKNIYTAVHYHADSAGGTVENCDFTNIRHSQYQGRGINNYDQDVNVLYCTFTNIERIGIFTYNPGTTTLIKGCTYTGKGDGDCLDYAVEAGNGGNITVEDCTITDCKGQVGSYISAGISATTAYGSGTTATITGCDIHDNRHGVWIGYGASDTTTATITNNNIYNNTGNGILARGTTTAHYNNIYGNGEYGAKTDYATVYDFEYNWWGDGSGPSGVGPGSGDAVSANIDYDPWTGSVSTTTGTGTAYFTPSAGTIGGVTAVATPPGPPVVLPHGMFSFNITGLTPGQEVTVTVKLPGPVPVGSVWWKYQGGSWYWLPIGSDDGDDTITITLKDGGQGDADKTVDGVIIDDGGSGLRARGLIINSTEGGRVTKPGEGNYVYDHGTVVKLVATPDDGYRFVEWTHDVRRIDDVNAASTTITMDYSYVIIANFVAEETPPTETSVQYELSVSSTMGGSVTSPGEGTFPYIEGTMVSLVANPATGYKFVNWTGDSITNVDSATVTVTMNGDHSVKANFEFEQTTTTDPTEGSSSGPLACFIATAAYGTPTAEQIDVLREFRDVVLLENSMGSEFVALYYQLSPPVADFIAGNSFLKTVVRELVVDPVVWIVEATGAIWRD
jgi:hypothetical protein